jgi:hypothetical protein
MNNTPRCVVQRVFFLEGATMWNEYTRLGLLIGFAMGVAAVPLFVLAFDGWLTFLDRLLEGRRQ